MQSPLGTVTPFELKYGRSLERLAKLKKPGDWMLRNKHYSAFTEASSGGRNWVAADESGALGPKVVLAMSNAAVKKCMWKAVELSKPGMIGFLRRLKGNAEMTTICSVRFVAKCLLLRNRSPGCRVELRKWLENPAIPRKYLADIFTELACLGELPEARYLAENCNVLRTNAGALYRSLMETIARQKLTLKRYREAGSAVRLFRWLQHYHYRATAEDMIRACRCGQTALVGFLHHKGLRIWKIPIVAAAENGHLSLLQSLDNWGMRESLVHAWIGATRKGQSHIWAYLTELKIRPPQDCLRIAIATKQAAFALYFVEHQQMDCSRFNLRHAAHVGMHELLEAVFKQNGRVAQDRHNLSLCIQASNCRLCIDVLERQVRSLGPLCMPKSRMSDEVASLMKETGKSHNCSICLSDVDFHTTRKGQTLFVTNCFHKFHSACLAQIRKHVCPICREPITSARI